MVGALTEAEEAVGEEEGVVFLFRKYFKSQNSLQLLCLYWIKEFGNAVSRGQQI